MSNPTQSNIAAPSEERLDFKKILPVFVIILVDLLGLTIIIPLMPLYATSFGANAMTIGLLGAAYPVMQFIGAPLLGELSDIFGRKRLLMVGVGGLAISQMLFGFGIETGSLVLLFASRILAGLSGANFSIAQAAIADVSEPHERAKNFGLMGAAFGIGFILGPALGGWIAEAAGNPAAPFWFAGILGIVNILLLTFFLRETHHDRQAAHHFHIWKGIENIRAAFRDQDAKPLYFSSFLYGSGFTFFTSSMRFTFVCMRPAVSTMTTSMSRDTAASMASKATAEGSEPLFW